MNGTEQGQLDPVLFRTAWTEGFMDSLSPYSLATVLVLIIILSVCGRSAWRVFWIGVVYIASSAYMHYTSALGDWDKLMTDGTVLSSVRVGYLILAVFFILIAAVDLIDWGKYKKSGNINVFRLNKPAFFQEKTRETGRPMSVLLSFLITTIISVLIAGLAALMVTTSPQSEFIYVVHSHMVAVGDEDFVQKLFFIYSAAISTLLIVAWIKIWWLALKKRDSIRALIYHKIVLSALFLSTGIGITYFYMN